jgi:hypothetical protein
MAQRDTVAQEIIIVDGGAIAVTDVTTAKRGLEVNLLMHVKMQPRSKCYLHLTAGHRQTNYKATTAVSGDLGCNAT